MKERLKPLVDPAFHGLLKLPAPDFKKTWLVKLFRAYGRMHWRFSKTDGDLKSENISLHSVSRKFKIEYFANQRLDGSRPCLVYFHGGAFVMPAFGHMKKHLASYAFGADCDVAFVDYSLSPETKSQEILEQCRLAYEWVIENSGRLQVDVNRLAAGGDSAGGALAASLTQMIHDKASAGSICGQLLIYPVIDDHCETVSMKEFWDCPFWSGKASERMWALYLADEQS
ncbi:MAG: alpha/beta hydrolase, partial [Gammaproteobacteria bacterium]|nr:alpha/beta hydrolase [Gammaproteobacteria bacterium]